MISVLIVNWCSGKWLRKCLRGLSRQSLAPDRVIVVDNASSDSSLRGIEGIIPSIEVRREKLNHGFAKANNIGLDMLEPTGWTVLLNPDAIPAPDWLEKLLAASADFPEYDFFACKMLSASCPEILDGAGGDIYHTCGLVWRYGHGKTVEECWDESRECFSPCAAAAMYKTEILKKIGGFDEDFFCYIEDVDLGFRLRLAGYKCLYVADAVVEHAGSAITGKKSDFSVFYGHRNMLFTYVKNMPGPLLWLYLPQHILMNIISIVFLTHRGQGKIALRAKYCALKKLPLFIKKRRMIQQRRVVGACELRRVLSRGGEIFRR